MDSLKSASGVTVTSLNVLIHVIILFTFLAGLFFLYISKIEASAFQSELGDVIEKSVVKLLDTHPKVVGIVEKPETKKVLTALIPLYDKPDRYIYERNVTVKFLAMFTVLTLFAIILSIVLTEKLDCKKDIGLKHIVMENVVIFICIGIVEYMFFTKVAMKFVPTPPSLLSDTIISAIKTNLS